MDGGNMSSNDMFSHPSHAQDYLKYRPSYPDHIYERIMQYLEQKVSPPHQQAVDVGCGSGQNTRPLARYFHKVLGTDVSEAPIEQAKAVKEPANIQYRVGNFDNLFLPDESVDLVTSSQACHWFVPIENFYKEADRVLKKNGVLAVYGYDLPTVSSDGLSTEELTQPYMKFYHGKEMNLFKTERVLLIEDHYRSLALPYAGWERIEGMTMKRYITLQEFIHYVGTSAGYVTYKRIYPGQPDPLVHLTETYQSIIGKDRQLDGTPCLVSHELFLLIGRKP